MGEFDTGDGALLELLDVDGQGGVLGGEHDDLAGQLIGLQP